MESPREKVMAMTQSSHKTDVTAVAACTTTAAHRRDHKHASSADDCHPHMVEVVGLGSRAVAICHDCMDDSGFLPRRDAGWLATAHRLQTDLISVSLARTLLTAPASAV
jgi:hypothetical protein